jgi:hypothetical protein
MIDKITDFSALEKSVKSSPDLKYKDAIIGHYKNLGTCLGYTARDNFSVIKNTVNYGKLDLIWVEPNVVFAAEFGSMDDIYKHLWRIIELAPKTAVLVLSSKSACKAEEVVKIIEKSKLTQDQLKSFVVLDVTEKKILKGP